MIGMIMNLSGSGEKSILNLIKKKLHMFCLLDLYLKKGGGSKICISVCYHEMEWRKIFMTVIYPKKMAEIKILMIIACQEMAWN